MKVEQVPSLYYLPATTKHPKQDYPNHVRQYDTRK